MLACTSFLVSLEKAIEEAMEDDVIDAISDISTDSIQESPNTKSLSKLQFKDPKSIRDYAAKVRKIERKIMLGLLTDSEEAKLRKSKFFSTRFEQLLNLSRTSKKSNLYKLVTWIGLNDMMLLEMQRKMDANPAQTLRKKLQLKVNNLKTREKAVQEKIASGTLAPNDVNNFLRDMYFIVKFGDDLLSLDHNSVFKVISSNYYAFIKGLLFKNTPPNTSMHVHMHRHVIQCTSSTCNWKM